MSIILESCVESVNECIDAELKGAHQLELCSHLEKDGLTPELSTTLEVLNAVRIPVKIMIREKSDNFYYGQDEILSMVDSIRAFKSYPVAGFVFGALQVNDDKTISMDLNATYQICKAAYPLPVTIHKAIDLCDDLIGEVNTLKDIFNVKFILTSGGKKTAAEGAEMLIQMQNKASGLVQIIAAGKITAQNLPALQKTTGLTYYHGKKIV